MVDTKAEGAIQNIIYLNDIHDKFMQSIKSLATEKDAVSKLKVDDDLITVTFYGIELTVKHKIIALDSVPKSIEYSFFIPDYNYDGQLVIYNMYLSQAGQFFNEPEQTNCIFNYNHRFIVVDLLTLVGDNLLKSKVFAPTELSQNIR